MKRSRITFYLYLSGNITTFLGLIILTIFIGIHYLVIGTIFLFSVSGTVRAYKEKHKLLHSHGQNPNVAGWFNGFIVGIFLVVLFNHIIIEGNKIPLVLSIILWLVALSSYIFGVMIYKKTPLNELTSTTEISEDAEEMTKNLNKMKEKIHEKESTVQELENRYSAGGITDQDKNELKHQKKTIKTEINAMMKFENMTEKLLRMELNSPTEPRKELILVEGDTSKINMNNFTKFTIHDDSFRAKVNLYCEGKGTSDDPIIIKPHRDFPEKFSMSFSTQHIIITDFNSDTQQVYFAACKNVTVRNCRVNWLYLRKCSNIRLENIKFNDKLFLKGCEHLVIEGCEIPVCKFRYCSENKFKNCWINQFKRIFNCRGNTFIRNNIPEKEIRKLYKNSYIKRATGISLLIFGIISIALPFILGFDILFFLLFLGNFLVFGIYIMRIDIKLTKRYREKLNPNQII